MNGIVANADLGAVPSGTTRRGVLRAAGIAAGGLALSQAIPVWGGLGAALAGGVGAEVFLPLVGETFSAEGGGRSFELVLSSVEVGVDHPGAVAVGEHFSLLFTGPSYVAGDSGHLAELGHPSLGTNTFFLAPVGGADQWQVVVDRRQPVN